MGPYPALTRGGAEAGREHALPWSRWSRLPRAASRWVLNLSSDGDPTAALSKLQRSGAALVARKRFLVFGRNSPALRVPSCLTAGTAGLPRPCPLCLPLPTLLGSPLPRGAGTVPPPRPAQGVPGRPLTAAHEANTAPGEGCDGGGAARPRAEEAASAFPSLTAPRFLRAVRGFPAPHPPTPPCPSLRGRGLPQPRVAGGGHGARSCRPLLWSVPPPSLLPHPLSPGRPGPGCSWLPPLHRECRQRPEARARTGAAARWPAGSPGCGAGRGGGVQHHCLLGKETRGVSAPVPPGQGGRGARLQRCRCCPAFSGRRLVLGGATAWVRLSNHGVLAVRTSRFWPGAGQEQRARHKAVPAASPRAPGQHPSPWRGANRVR